MVKIYPTEITFKSHKPLYKDKLRGVDMKYLLSPIISFYQLYMTYELEFSWILNVFGYQISR